MKTILVPTDFSKSAQNALEYAIEIAKRISAKLILFHAYQLPPVTSEVPVVLSVSDIEKQIVRNLKKAERYIHSNHGEALVVEYDYRCGFPVEEIRLCVERKKADLIVMGLHGAGFLKEKLIGSVATALVNNSKCPVMIINQNVKFKSIKNVALAFDYSEIKNKGALRPLNDLTNLFKSHIFIFNVVQSKLEAISSISKAVDGMKLAHALENAEHSFHYSENDDIVEGINKFVIEKKIDMVVMIPHKHSPLHNLFNESQTKKMAFHTRIPLLTLSESSLSK
jgi:nucleotide-binding universal stress UspA family protein